MTSFDKPEEGEFSPEQKNHLSQVMEIFKKYGEEKSFWIQQTNDITLHFNIIAETEVGAEKAKQELKGLGYKVVIENGKLYLDAEFTADEIDQIRGEIDINDLRDKE